MKTLGKTITSEFFQSENGFEKINKLAAKLGKTKAKLTPAQFLVLNAIRGRDWTKSFVLPSNNNKLANGGLGASGLLAALETIGWLSKETQGGIGERALIFFLEPFRGIITPEGFKALARRLPSVTDCLVTAKVGGVTLFNTGSVVAALVPEAFVEVMSITQPVKVLPSGQQEDIA